MRSQTVNPVNYVLLLLWRQEKVYRNGVGSNIRVGDKNCAMDLENIAPYLAWNIKYRGNNCLFIRMRYNAIKKNNAIGLV